MSLFNRNFTKPGKGISKEDVDHENKYPFLSVLKYKKAVLVKLNLLYLLFCLPIIATVFFYFKTGISLWTILCAVSTVITGIGTAGFTTILRCLVRNEHVFFLSEFFEGIKKNWKQSIAIYSIFAVILLSLSLAAYTYSTIAMFQFFKDIILGLVYIFLAIIVFMFYYVYIIMITFHLKTFEIIRNAALFVVLGLWRNIAATLIIAVNAALFILPLPIFPLQYIYLAFFCISLTGFFVLNLVYPVIKEYMLDPLKNSDKGDDEENEESTFTDVK